MQLRRQKITELINREGQISFSRLKEAFPEVSDMTLRTDLKCLDEEGAIIRVHGGAKSIETVAGTDGLLAHRIIRNQDKKNQIAQKAIPLLRSASSVFIDSGSTTTLFSHYIPDEPRQIFTCGISCITELAVLSQVTVNLFGGRLNRYSLSVAGSRSILELQACHFDVCFLGTTSFHPDYGFCCESEDDCLLKQVVIQRSNSVVVLMDSSKFGLSSTHCICMPNTIHTLVSDDALSQTQRDYFTKYGISVL